MITNYMKRFVALHGRPVSPRACWQDMESVDLTQPEALPQVLLAYFVTSETPFLEEALQKIAKLEYPKEKIDLYVHNEVWGRTQMPVNHI